MLGNKLIAMAAMIFTPCVSSQQLPPPPQNPIFDDPNARSVDSSMVLDAEDLNMITVDAEAGDGFAAFRLSRHFAYLQKNRQSEYWLLYSAARGHPAAQYSLWFSLKDEADCKSRIHALAWVRSAALNGSDSAKDKVTDFTKVVQPCLQ